MIVYIFFDTNDDKINFFSYYQRKVNLNYRINNEWEDVY